MDTVTGKENMTDVYKLAEKSGELSAITEFMVYLREAEKKEHDPISLAIIDGIFQKLFAISHKINQEIRELQATEAV